MAWCTSRGPVVLLVLAVLASPIACALLVVLYTHAYWLLDRVWLATVIIAVATAATGSAAARHLAGSDMTNAAVLGIGVSTFVLGSSIGLLIRRQVEQGRQRDQLMRDLEQTRTELAAAHRREGAAAERERMAREIHDTLAQGFTSIVMLVQAADAAADTDLELTHRRLELAERTARENLAEARLLVNAQRPAGLEQSSLDQVVRRLAEQAAELAGLDCTVRTAEFAGKLTANQEVTIVRAAQEALANVRRHAQASRITVCLRSAEEGTVLEIIDNGKGFPAGEVAGFGLTSIRSRTEEVGGTVTITSAPGEGTHVRMVIP
ncbi:sensor histidine kinase [Saccharomonospora sp. NPDC046836]|uniref:sensor histidine kinase n=1 Tax=Saccharomonospora sp. NPDC046836 TaxID=3156921 RepID=UPI0033DFF5EC